MKRTLTILLLGALANLPTHALPLLQLDASPGQYVDSSESTIATNPTFTLFAMLDSLAPSGTYYIAAGLTPSLDQFPVPSLGSFTFNGETVNAVGDMTYGAPALMPGHGVYPTYYKEFSFTFDTSSAHRFHNYNVEDVVGEHAGVTQSNSGKSLFMAFEVDVTNLAAGSTLVFDLYTYNASGKGKVKFVKAPFSHNAEAGGGGGVAVPEGGASLAMLVLGLALTFWSKRHFFEQF